MKQLQVDLRLTFNKKQRVHFKITLHTKYSLLTGNSAIGKTMTANKLYRALHSTSKLYADFLGNKWTVVRDVKTLFYDLDADIYLIDEELSKVIDLILCNKYDKQHEVLVRSLQKATCKFIFIKRGMSGVPIDYKSIYTLDSNTPVSNVIRMFPDYLNFNKNLPIITEDSKTGFEYYKYWFKNVLSSYGKNNLQKYAKTGIQLVADGSAIGYLIELLTDSNLYLPESFEYDLANAWKPLDTKQLLELQPNNSQSIEQYFAEYALPKLCEKYHIVKYSKSNKLQKMLLEVRIHKDDKLSWCKEHAPSIIKNLSDNEILELMSDAWNNRDLQ